MVEKRKSALAKVQDTPRTGIPDDIANAAIYLGSDEASFVKEEDKGSDPFSVASGVGSKAALFRAARIRPE